MLRQTQHKIATYHKNPCGRIFSWLALITAIGNGIVFTILPIILEEKLHNESYVGYYYSLASIIIMIASIYSTILFQKFSKVSIIKATLSITILSLFGLSFAENVWQIGGLDIPRIICIITFGVALSIFISEFTKKQNLGKEEGKFYMFYNIGLLFGPLIGGYASRYFGNKSIFIFAAIFYSLAFVLFLYQHVYQKNPHIHDNKHQEGTKELLLNVKEYFKKTELLKVFLVAFGLNYWWAVSIVYIPLEIHNLGFGDNIVGWVVAAMALPLIFLEKIIGKFADKRGVRMSITIGFTLLSLFIVIFPAFYGVPKIALLAFCFVNIGAAWIEPLQETYFFKVVKPTEREKFYGIYNAAQPLSAIVSPFLGGLFYALGGSTLLWIGTAIFLGLFILNGLFIEKKY